MNRAPSIAAIALLTLRWIFAFPLFAADGGTAKAVAPTDGKREMRIGADAPLAPSCELALADFERALKRHRIATFRSDATLTRNPPSVIVGIAGASAFVDSLLREKQIDLPPGAESLCIRRVADNRCVVIAGRDARGLAYALMEAARAAELAPEGGNPLDAIVEGAESPFLRTRSLTMHLFNHDLESRWYGDPEFWDAYLAMLARCRFNNFTLTFADQTNYLNPPYAHLVAVPGYPDVRVEGLDDAQRKRNLEMLRDISARARARGLSFTLGIWTHLPVAKFVGGSRVHGLPEGVAAARYCAAGLREVLEACPGIDGLQFRMNAEAGVAEDQQREFYRPLFAAIRECGRPVRVDLRYKGLRPETTRDAVALGLDVTVSTKFWTEHFGLPYHPTVVDSHYRDGRYSFGSMLGKPRDYRVVYQLWSVGSQRLLLWGDPAYAAQFARNCKLGDGEGFEVFAPLSDKGFGNAKGDWRILADPSREHYRWEFERYWLFYNLFGRLGYNPSANAEIWRREFRHRFGPSAVAFEAAFKSASEILPLITAVRMPSASEWSWWPEMDTGDRVAEYMRTPAGDPAQFYAIRSWQRTPLWRCEEWDATPGYVEDAVAGRLRGKWTPIQVAARLRELARQTIAHLETAHATTAEARMTEVDLRVLAALAEYHAAKTMAATELAFFESTHESARAARALPHMKAALAAWEHIVKLTDGVYSSNLVFGYAPEHGRRQGHHHSGSWKDRLPEVREDVAYLETLLAQQGDRTTPHRTFPGEKASPALPEIRHTPIASAKAGEVLRISARIASSQPVRSVVLHFRALNQTLDWHELPMIAKDEDGFEATIPATEIPANWDLQYYFEVLTENGGCIRPSWQEGPPYVVVKVR